MVLITIVTGVYKPIYNWGAPHCRDACKESVCRLTSLKNNMFHSTYKSAHSNGLNVASCLRTVSSNRRILSFGQARSRFAASLRAWPCAITPRDKPGSMRAGQSTMWALKLDTVQGWSGVVEFSSLCSAESLHKFQPKC